MPPPSEPQKLRLLPQWPWELYAMIAAGLSLVAVCGWFVTRQFTEISRAETLVRTSLNVKLRGRCTFVTLRRSNRGYEGVVGDINGSTYPISASIDAQGLVHYQCALASN